MIDSEEIIESPFRLKPSWKSKSRKTSQKKKNKRPKSNQISEGRRRKFSGSEELVSNNNISPFKTKVPHNTRTKAFYSKKREKSRNKNFAKVTSSPTKRKKSKKKNYSSRKPNKSKESKQTVKNIYAGGRDLSGKCLNLMIGDRNNEISQMYSQINFDFGKKAVLLLKSLKMGFDMDYITGIQMEYVVGRIENIEREYFCLENENVDILKVEDPSKIKGKIIPFLKKRIIEAKSPFIKT